MRPLGIEIRSGLHTGEVEVGENDVRGVVVHVAARVTALAEPNECLVTRTVKDLIAGSGVECSDRGSHVLNGVAGRWRLFAVKQ